jgi:uncharacterized membrane protein YfcA
MENAPLILTALLVAGLVKGIVGLGLPAVALAILGLALPPAQAAALIVVPSILTNIWQAWSGPDFRGLLRRLAPLLLGTVAGVWGAMALGLGINDPAIQRAGGAVLGAMLAIYALTALLLPVFRVPAPAERRTAPAIGVATGVVTAATGLLLIPGAAWIQALGLPRDALVQALGIFLTVGNTAFGAGLAVDGVLGAATLAASLLLALPAALAGQWVGTRLRQVIDPRLFRRVFLFALLALGLYQAVRPFL